jgi:hypothetical protein
VDGLLDRMFFLQGLIGLRYSPMGQNELRTIFLKTAPWLLCIEIIELSVPKLRVSTLFKHFLCIASKDVGG